MITRAGGRPLSRVEDIHSENKTLIWRYKMVITVVRKQLGFGELQCSNRNLSQITMVRKGLRSMTPHVKFPKYYDFQDS